MEKKYFADVVKGNCYKVTDPFYAKLMQTVKEKVIPYQWEALNDRVPGAEKSYCIENFKAAAGESNAEHHGWVFQDSDLAKWIEAASLSLLWQENKELEQNLAEVVALLGRAQMDDGYMNTYYILGNIDERWTNLKDNHELYCIGHFIEAAVAYYRATGKDSLIKIMDKCVEQATDVIGREDGKLRGYPGHEEIELALVKLYEVTGDAKYLDFASYFVDERGQAPNFFAEEDVRQKRETGWNHEMYSYEYYQADKPVREQTDPAGHAVRANYLYAGMADVARCKEDESLYKACKTLWDNIVNKYMYVTGQTGATSLGEAYSYAYDLPNDTAYAETCAGLALVFFAQRMLRIEQKGEYADVMERALYNGTISGMSLDGTRFFYVNPLEVNPVACEKEKSKRHVKAERQKWFGCACCPPNLARTVASISEYAASYTEDTLFQHLYLGGEICHTFGDKAVKIKMDCNYPWDGDIKIEFEPSEEATFTYAVRIPGWCKNYTVTLNGTACSDVPKDGYLYLTRNWKPGDVLELSLDMPVQTIYANLAVRENTGKVAVQRGPVVFCAEEADNGKNLHQLFLKRGAAFTTRFEADLLGGVMTLECDGCFMEARDNSLYTTQPNYNFTDKKVKLVPYYAWNNRGIGEMAVWLHEKV